jgi:DNA replication protein DnaD
VTAGVRSGIIVLERIELLLDQGSDDVVISPYYKNRTNAGTPAGRNDAMQEKLDAHQEEMKTQVSSLAFRIDINPEEMTARLEAKIDENQEKMQTNQEEMKSRMGALVSRMDIHQARTEAIQEEIIAKMDVYWETMEANMNAWQEWNKACVQKTEGEANPRGESERSGAP